MSRADHADERQSVKIRQTALIVKYQRRVGNILQPVGVCRILISQNLQLLPLAVFQNPFRRAEVLVLQRFHALRRQAIHLPVAFRVCEVNILRVLKMMHQFHLQPVADSVPCGQPDPMDDHFHFPSFSIL